MSETQIAPLASLPAKRTTTNEMWWVVAIVGIVAVAIIAGVCIVRGKTFSGQFAVGQRSWYGTKVYVGCR